MLTWLQTWRYPLIAVLLAVAMLIAVLVLRPAPEMIALCFLAWFGGVACALAAETLGKMVWDRS